MQRPKRKKAYKQCEPLQTIQKIRNILVSSGLFTIEANFRYTVPNVNCCRICLGDETYQKLNIGTNGKGLTARYALASAYGELMERLQNQVLFPVRQNAFASRAYLESGKMEQKMKEILLKNNLALDFQFAPDERILSASEVLEQCEDVLAAAFHKKGNSLREYFDHIYEKESFICVPFYSVAEEKVRLLPAKMIWNTCGTNGMCAGNAPQEAILQGISELFERYVIREIYMKQLSPPDIPVEYFEDSAVGERLQHMESQGYGIKIKDCSLGKGLPVIGLMIEKKDGRRAFHLGADPCAITALERCLTEMFQGTPQSNDTRYHAPSELELTEKSTPEEKKAFFSEYAKTVECGNGIWPKSVFQKQATWEFKTFAHPISVDDAADYEYYKNKLQEMGMKLFIRDVSWLGIPAYQLYVPGMAETDFLFEYFPESFYAWLLLDRCHRTLLNLPHASKGEREELLYALEEIERHTSGVCLEIPKWFLSSVNEKLFTLKLSELKAFLAGSCGDYKKAVVYMEEFLKEEEAEQKPLLYYRTMKMYWQLRADGNQTESAYENIVRQFGEALAKRCLDEELFAEADWPSCFSCDQCGLRDDCRYLEVLTLVKSLQNIYKENLPDQRKNEYI